MAVKAILRGGSIENAVRLQTRHATPRPFSHIILNGSPGRAFWQQVNQAATGLFVFGLHPLSALPAEALTHDGELLHRYQGRSDPTLPVDDEGNVLPPAQRAALVAASGVIECYFQGWLNRFANGRRADDTPFIALSLSSATLLDSIAPSAVAWRSDQQAWSACPAEYKRLDGSPRVDPDDVQETTLVQWTDPAAALPPP